LGPGVDALTGNPDKKASVFSLQKFTTLSYIFGYVQETKIF